MSYILDALRRADSERDRGAVPTLFGQPLPRVSVDSETAHDKTRWVWAVLGIGVLALVGMVAWRLTAPAAPAVPVAQAPTAGPAAATPQSDATQPAVAALTAPTGTSAMPPTNAPPAPAPAAQARVTEPARPARKPVRSEASTADRPLATAATAATSAAPSAAESRVYARNELPSDVQRALPTLAIGGASYSESPANRMLIINGQVFHEGDKLAPDLVLEQIKLKAAVLRYKGYRYGVSY